MADTTEDDRSSDERDEEQEATFSIGELEEQLAQYRDDLEHIANKPEELAAAVALAALLIEQRLEIGQRKTMEGVKAAIAHIFKGTITTS